MKDVKEERLNIDIVQEELPTDLNSLMPSLNVNIPTNEESESKDVSNLITDDALMGIYGEILQNIREDREEVSGLLTTFSDMIMNEGETSNATKEAVVNLAKVKSDMADKMSKVADLMTRIKLKERDTFPKYLAQNNTININKEKTNTRGFLQDIEKVTKK